MIKSLLILGAGASKDFSEIFPTGRELIKEINYHFHTEKNSDKTGREGYYLSALMNFIVDMLHDDPENSEERFNKIKNALWRIQLGYESEYLRDYETVPISIDSFVTSHLREKDFDDTDIFIIKCCVYYLFKGFEQAKSEQKFFGINWIFALASKVSKFDAADIINNFRIITFNYDRLFEKYFCQYLINETVFTEENSEQFIYNNIQHVYGSLGSLNEVPFKLHNNISPAMQTVRDLEFINEELQKSIDVPGQPEKYKVHFMGFGYDKKNIKALNLDQFKCTSFYGTAYNFSANQKEEIKKELSRNIELYDLTCTEYINQLNF